MMMDIRLFTGWRVSRLGKHEVEGVASSLLWDAPREGRRIVLTRAAGLLVARRRIYLVCRGYLVVSGREEITVISGGGFWGP
jgi:hypothetical protein